MKFTKKEMKAIETLRYEFDIAVIFLRDYKKTNLDLVKDCYNDQMTKVHGMADMLEVFTGKEITLDFDNNKIYVETSNEIEVF